MNWFERTFGVRECNDWSESQQLFQYDQGQLTVKQTGTTFDTGHFSTPSLKDLRAQTHGVSHAGGAGVAPQTSFRVEYGDVSEVIADPENHGATFMVASQLNCLEFIGPDVKPEHGITGYEHDRTQGPACSIACGPATVVRNYFVEVEASRGVRSAMATATADAPPRPSSATARVVPPEYSGRRSCNGTTAAAQPELGQRACRQINNADAMLAAFALESRRLTVQNGYLLAESAKPLQYFAKQLEEKGVKAQAEGLLKVGVHEHTQVTSKNFGRELLHSTAHRVTQVFCSAAPVAYCMPLGVQGRDWAPLATLLLRASFEATLRVAATVRASRPDCPGANRVFLTPIGGGAFGNDMQWIADALHNALARCQGLGLEVVLVQYAPPLEAPLAKVTKQWQGQSPATS